MIFRVGLVIQQLLSSTYTKLDHLLLALRSRLVFLLVHKVVFHSKFLLSLINNEATVVSHGKLFFHIGNPLTTTNPVAQLQSHQRETIHFY